MREVNPFHSPDRQLPLWQQLQAAAAVLAAVTAGRSGTAALGAVSGPVRPGAQALVYHAWRQWGRAQALRQVLAKRAPPAGADALLCLALALAWDSSRSPYEAHTLVDQTIEAAKRGPAKAQASFINACLRRFLREQAALVEQTNADPVARWNHPRWWIERVRQDHPQHWQAILQANNSQAALTLRINRRKVSVAAYQQQLLEQGMASQPTGASGLVLAGSGAIPALPGYAEGWFSVQDAGAQLAAPLLLDGLETHASLHILDACAAPGGKTAHLLEYSDARVVALDVDGERCQRIRDNLQRLQLHARVLAADAGNTASWWPAQCQSEPFDAVLLDAPCTASGIVRRHPDVRWLRREGDIAQMATQQERLLKALWPLLKPGGRLLYCTCSVFLAEGTAQMETFLGHNSDARLRPSPGHLLPQNGANPGLVTDNAQGVHDGFFYALLEKHRV